MLSNIVYSEEIQYNFGKEIISAAENEPNFMNLIVTGDKTLCFQYDPKTKRQSTEWKSKNSPEAKKQEEYLQKSKQCLLLTLTVRVLSIRNSFQVG